ncbi:ATP-binding protein, partial [Candidatus Pacearchaeota archaeon]|nr:ATP-binding protein [Candidatus Pacearchaeota archaeon]
MVQEKLTIDIQPPVSVYATYRRLSYLPWYAIAEFVDNSTQNYYDFEEKLKKKYENEKVKNLRVEIEYNKNLNSLSIRDNAHGMGWEELERAVKLNKPPKNHSGRCEFGMGLKTAACWFGRNWTIATTRLNEENKYIVNV